MKKVKYLLIGFSLFFLILPSTSSAQTAEELMAKIKELMAQVQQLQVKLAEIQGQAPSWCYDFTVNLKIGMGGSEIGALQIALEKEGFSLSQEEKNEKRFDESTASAVSGFQEKYRDEILTPLGLKYSTGYVGKATRAKLNELYGCAKPTTPIPSTPICIQVITPAKDPQTGLCKEFSTPCDVPQGWVKVDKCPSLVCEVSVFCAEGYKKVTAGTDEKGCPVYKCLSLVENQPPVIHGISGPVTLKMYEIGTWTVKASDPEQGILTYSVSWGDDPTAGTQIAPKATTYTQTATLTHGYFKVGTYNPVFIVADDKGLLAKVTFSIRVEEVVGIGFIRFELIDSSLCPPCLIGTTCASCPPLSAMRIYNAKVTVYDEKGNYVDTQDTSSGTVLFKNLPYGNYTATFSAPGFETDKSTFPVGPNMGTDVTVNLKKSSTTTTPTTTPSLPVLRMISPNGGEIWQIGSTQQIQWSGQTGGNIEEYAKVILELTNESKTVGYGYEMSNLPLSTENDGYYQWVIPGSLTPGKYNIRIRCVGNCGNLLKTFDDSDQPFSLVAMSTAEKSCADLKAIQSYYFNICSNQSFDNVCFNKFSGEYQGCSKNTWNDCTLQNANADKNILCSATGAPSITVLSPIGKELWRKGSVQNIRWNATSDITSVYIKLRKGNDTYPGPEGAVSDVIAADSGSYQWIIPSTLPDGNDYSIRVINQTGKVFNDSHLFSITATISCADSDEKNYYLKGTAASGATSAVDICLNPNTSTTCEGKTNCVLIEYFCGPESSSSGNAITKEIYDCPNGCKDGACLPKPENLSQITFNQLASVLESVRKILDNLSGFLKGR